MKAKYSTPLSLLREREKTTVWHLVVQLLLHQYIKKTRFQDFHAGNCVENVEMSQAGIESIGAKVIIKKQFKQGDGECVLAAPISTSRIFFRMKKKGLGEENSRINKAT